MSINVDAKEFEAAALPHLNDLFRSARRVVGNTTDAEDIIQETYLQAWKSFHRFEPGTNCRAWLFKIMFHLIHHHRRKTFKYKHASDGEEILLQTVANESAPDYLRDEEILKAFQKIPEQYRDIVLMADVNEFSYKEIAAALDIPAGTVMSRLSRGRKALRAALARVASAYGINDADERIFADNAGRPRAQVRRVQTARNRPVGAPGRAVEAAARLEAA